MNSATEGRTATLLRLAVVLAGAMLGLLVHAPRSAAQSPECPLANCTWKVASTCGVCYTINGPQVMYKKGLT